MTKAKGLTEVKTVHSIEDVVDKLDHHELAEIHVELIDIAKDLQGQVETLLVYAKSLEMENKTMRMRLDDC